MKLRERLSAAGWRDEVMVGTTEEFQVEEIDKKAFSKEMKSET